MSEHDLVPHLPPEPFFTHFGGRRLLKADLGKKATSGLGLWTRIRRGFMDWFDEITKATSRAWNGISPGAERPVPAQRRRWLEP